MTRMISIIKEITKGDEIFEVKYTLREQGEGGTRRVYGFCIEEYLWTGKEKAVLIDAVETPPVFDSYSSAEKFYMMIIDEEVFPQTLYDHIDDWHCAFHPSQSCF